MHVPRLFDWLKASLSTCVIAYSAMLGIALAAVDVVAQEQVPSPERPQFTAVGEPVDSEPLVDRYGDSLPAGAIARLGTTRFRHGGSVLAVAYAADGKSLVTASEDETVRRWDAVSGKELARFAAPGFAALSPDGSLFVSIETADPKERKNRIVRLHSTITDQEVGRFEWFGRHGDRRSAHNLEAVFSRDGSTLAVGGYTAKVILLWDVVRGRAIRSIEYIGLGYLALSPDGKTLLAGGDDELWDVATGEKRQTFNVRYSYGDTVVAAFSLDGRTVALGGSDASFALCDVATGKTLHHLKGRGQTFGGSGGAVSSLAFSTDGKTLAVGSRDWTVRLWDVGAGEQLRQMVGPTFGNVGDHGSVSGLAFAPDDRTLAVASNVPLVWRWDVASGREIKPPGTGHRDTILSIAYSHDGKRLATASTDLTMRIWDPATGEQLCQLEGHRGSINGVAFSPDGRYLVSVGGYQDETLRWWDATTGQSLRVLNAGYFNGVAYAPDGNTVATANSEGIRLWDAKTGAALRLFAGRANHVQFSQDGLHVSDGVRIWSLAGGELVNDRTNELSTVNKISYSPDWKLVAVASELGHGSGIYSARLLEVITGREIHVFARENLWMSSATFSPDGLVVATAENKGIRLWETTTGRELLRMESGLQTRYYPIAFAPDGRTLAAVNSDTSVLVSRVPPTTKQQPITALPREEFARLWGALASDDAPQAYAATLGLIRASDLAIPLMKNHVRPVTAPNAEQLERLIADLEDDRFDTRQKASDALAQLGELAEPALRRALEGKPSLETRQRVKTLLTQRWVWSGERLRQWRTIQVLESVGSQEAQALLKTLADGAPASRLTQEARAALSRIARGSPVARFSEP